MVSKFYDPSVNHKREIEVLAHSAKISKIVISFIAIQSWSVKYQTGYLQVYLATCKLISHIMSCDICVCVHHYSAAINVRGRHEYNRLCVLCTPIALIGA